MVTELEARHANLDHSIVSSSTAHANLGAAYAEAGDRAAALTEYETAFAPDTRLSNVRILEMRNRDGAR